MCNEDDRKATATQTDPLHSSDSETKNDYIEAKPLTHWETLPMKAGSESSKSQVKIRCEQDHDALVACLQQRIDSLEKQLQVKQTTIKILLGLHMRKISWFVQESSSGVQGKGTQCGNKNDELPVMQSVDQTKAKDAKTTVETEQPRILNQELMHAQAAMKTREVQSKQLEDQNFVTWHKQVTTKGQKRIAIVGDSTLVDILDGHLKRYYNVLLNFHGGATTKDMLGYIRPLIKQRLDCIIIHAGANDLGTREKIDTIENFRKIIEQIRRESPDTTIALSTVFKLYNGQMKGKMSILELDHEIKELASKMKVSVIDNSHRYLSSRGPQKWSYGEKRNIHIVTNILTFIKDFCTAAPAPVQPA